MLFNYDGEGGGGGCKAVFIKFIIYRDENSFPQYSLEL